MNNELYHEGLGGSVSYKDNPKEYTRQYYLKNKDKWDVTTAYDQGRRIQNINNRKRRAEIASRNNALSNAMIRSNSLRNIAKEQERNSLDNRIRTGVRDFASEIAKNTLNLPSRSKDVAHKGSILVDRLLNSKRRQRERDARNAQVSRAQDYAARRRTVARAPIQNSIRKRHATGSPVQNWKTGITPFVDNWRSGLNSLRGK